MMIAQATDLTAVPDAMLKWVLIILISLGLVALAAYSAFRKPEKTRVKIEDDPAVEVRKAPKRYNHDAVEHRFVTIESRVGRHEDDIEKLKDLFRVDLPEMERRLDSANEERVSEVHQRVNEILGEVKEMRGELKHRR